MAAAKRRDPGALVTPAEAGAVAVSVCRLSGMRATARCATMDEWFARGTEPATPDTWEDSGVAHLPDEYAEWSRQFASVPVRRDVVSSAAPTSEAPPIVGLRITSPSDGDRYWVPTGDEARYATIPLRAVGAHDVRWSVDGRDHREARLTLVPGEPLIRAVADNGEHVDVRIRVERQ